MKTRIALGTLAMMFVLALSAYANGKNELQNYFNTTAQKVKATNVPSEKRAILNGSFQAMSEAIDMAQRSPLISNDDVAGIGRIRASIREKQDELSGTNGYERVPDVQLNAFSNYVVQDMEQADQVVSISLVSLLLILILVVLIV